MWAIYGPLIQMLPENDKRKPYPISWEEQTRLFKELPEHLARMCLFKVNTGTREQEVCRLRWSWEVLIPELEDTTVFVIPGELVKNREDRIVVLNHTARSIIDSVRGVHPEFVFTYKYKPLTSINNTAWQRVRKKVGLDGVRVHDLKHTFGRRLRSAGVTLETRKVLLGHTNNDITTHYSGAEIHELIEAANKVCEDKSGKTPAMTLIRSLKVAV